MGLRGRVRGSPGARHGPARDDPLRLAEGIHLRGVDERDAELQRAPDHGGRLVSRVRGPVAPFARPELPRAKADRRNPHAVNLKVLHAVTLLRTGRMGWPPDGSAAIPGQYECSSRHTGCLLYTSDAADE